MLETPEIVPGIPSSFRRRRQTSDYTERSLEAQQRLNKRKEKRSEAPEHEASARPQAATSVGTSPDHLPIVAGDPLLNWACPRGEL